MLKTGFSIFLILHGLVHLLYLGHSQRLFELQPDMAWPARSWAFSTLLGPERTSWLAGVSCLLIAAALVAGGAGLLFGQGWWRSLTVGAAAFSIVIFLLLWDGRGHNLDDQGAVNLLLNAAILALVLGRQWPAG